MKLNCWEYKKCGRQPRGENSDKLGICPASTETKLQGTNNGINAGRSCWAVAGTMCGGKKQGSFVSKLGGCSKCDFYRDVRSEEGEGYEGTKKILVKLKP